MSIHRIAPFASTAAIVIVLLCLDVMPSAASAESGAQASSSTIISTEASESQRATQARRGAGACRVTDRSKHRIVHCDCPSDPIASVGSVDAAAMLRLVFGTPMCRTQPGR